MNILCENCGRTFHATIYDGDEGSLIRCPFCGFKGILYISITEG